MNMASKSVFKYLRGYVKFQAIGGFHEKFLTALFDARIKLWGVEKNGVYLTAYAYRESYLGISRLARRYGVKLKVISRRGTAFIALKYQKRYGFFIGLLLFALFLSIMSSFIWRIDVEGNETVSTGKILQIVEDMGVRPGAYAPSLDFDRIEREALYQLNELSWLSINKHGSKITIDVQERIFAPYIVPLDHPCNIIAGKTGQILSAKVHAGKMLIPLKSTVAKGDIIVSGAYEDGGGGVIYAHSQATIIAQYAEQKTFYMALTQTERLYTGDEERRYYLHALGIDFPLFVALPQSGSFASQEETESKLRLFGLTLPLTLKGRTYAEYEEKQVTFSEEEIKARLLEQAAVYEQSILPPTKVIQKEAEFSTADNSCTLTMSYILEGDIAVKSEILANNKNTAFITN